MKIELSNADMNAILTSDRDFILNKGADLYTHENYCKAAEYYHLAAAMGEPMAASNLGYCYLYGRHIEQNTSLAIAYFQIAAKQQNIEALYKLGNIYSTDKYVPKDKELSVYYYEAAFKVLRKQYYDLPSRYASLYLALAEEHLPGGCMNTDIEGAYHLLKAAERGYVVELKNGAAFYTGSLEKTRELLESDLFDEVKAASGDDEDEDDFYGEYTDDDDSDSE